MIENEVGTPAWVRRWSEEVQLDVMHLVEEMRNSSNGAAADEPLPAPPPVPAPVPTWTLRE